MMWRRPIDYHGSRSYGSRPTTETLASRIRQVAGFYVAWAKLQFQTLLRFGIAPAAEIEPLITRNERRFSLLGSKIPDRRGAKLRPDDCPFPLASDRSRPSARSKETV